MVAQQDVDFGEAALVEWVGDVLFKQSQRGAQRIETMCGNRRNVLAGRFCQDEHTLHDGVVAFVQQPGKLFAG